MWLVKNETFGDFEKIKGLKTKYQNFCLFVPLTLFSRITLEKTLLAKCLS